MSGETLLAPGWSWDRERESFSGDGGCDPAAPRGGRRGEMKRGANSGCGGRESVLLSEWRGVSLWGEPSAIMYSASFHPNQGELKHAGHPLSSIDSTVCVWLCTCVCVRLPV